MRPFWVKLLPVVMAVLGILLAYAIYWGWLIWLRFCERPAANFI